MDKPYLKLPTLTEQDVLRFWAKVDKREDDECWPWQAGKDWDGYGVFRLNYPKRACYRAHRIAYFLTTLDDPMSLVLRHYICDNPPCCNPNHMKKGTTEDNNHDCKIKGRTAKGDKNGARLYPERLMRGEQVHRSKLTERDVLELRYLYKLVPNYAKLAQLFNINKSTAARIVRRQTWTHI